ncbi:hypothetical protein [Alcanivorax sp.]|uniref:hypothetical protein n=1 Tax=Alcanivorax sp. TaxID=1872427 RepID=UPI003A8F0A69
MASTLFDKLCLVSHEELSGAVKLADGAAYILSKTMFADNVVRLTDSLLKEYSFSKVGYSFKTNYSSELIEEAVAKGALKEVVSLTEFEYALSLGGGSENIIFNGPGKSDTALVMAMASDCLLIADSIQELERISELKGQGSPMQCRIGVRITPSLSFMSGGSRFGVDFEDNENISRIRTLVLEHGLPISGVHLHITEDRSVGSYIERLFFLKRSWEKLDIGKPAFIDCGGGFASAMPEEIQKKLSYEVSDLEEYGEALGREMKRFYPDEDVMLVCEPGTGLLADVGVFVTPVLDVKKVKGKNVAVVDGTIFSVNPLRSPAPPLVKIVSQVNEGDQGEIYDIYGNSCMEIDVLARGVKADLKKGDFLIFAQKGAYASCMSSPFIQGSPATLAVDEAGDFSLLRQRSSYQSLYL